MNLFRLYRTNYKDFNLLLQDSNFLLNSADALKLINITISLFGKFDVTEFDNIEEGLVYHLNKVINYKFIEIKQDNGVGIYYVVENNILDKKAYLTDRMMGIGGKWNLYINSWDHIYVQGKGSLANSRYNFTSHNSRYSYLSILLYTLTHIEHDDLEVEFKENVKII